MTNPVNIPRAQLIKIFGNDQRIITAFEALFKLASSDVVTQDNINDKLQAYVDSLPTSAPSSAGKLYKSGGNIKYS